MSDTLAASSKTYRKADYATDQEVRWCPGCGDYAILASVQKVLADMQMVPENTVFVSGIGCSGRFPYYMNTYGFHTLHGRAPTVATGIKLANPDLNVWLVTGDGDALSIGGNHLLHVLRRNLDITILLFNNRIYGLTKGQYSPTSEQGKVTKTSPQGSVDAPVDPLRFALAAGATFVARALDVDAKHLQSVLKAAAEHKGTSIVEIYQNCNIFNDGAFEAFGERKARPEGMLYLEQGQPLIFGAERNKGLRLNGFAAEVVEFDPANPPNDLLVHDAEQVNPTYANIVSQWQYPEFPVPMGILRQVTQATFTDLLHQQQVERTGTLAELFSEEQSWLVK